MNPKIYVHPTSHLIHQDCLRDGEAQGKVFTRRAATNLGEFDVVAMGQFDRVLQWRDLIVKFYLPGATVNAAVVLELPQRMNGGGTPSWDDLVEISTYLRGKRVKLHMDGARLFEVLPYYGKPLEELAALFDTVYVSFYKGIGALASAMVVGPRDVLDAVRAQGFDITEVALPADTIGLRKQADDINHMNPDGHVLVAQQIQAGLAP